MSDIAPQFKDSPLLTRTSSPTQSQLILQARKYLEERWVTVGHEICSDLLLSVSLIYHMQMLLPGIKST